MDTAKLLQAMFILIASVVFLATASIGLEAYNADPKIYEAKPSNYNFLVVGVGLSVMSMLLSMYMMYQAYGSQPQPSYY
jgi:hypothetical protein